MAVNLTAPEGARAPGTESPLFAPTPLWARDMKKRRARSAAGKPRSDPAIDAGEPGAGAGVLGATTAAEPIDTSYETQSAEAVLRTTTRRSNGVAVGTIAASVVIVAALGAIGWYASERHDGGVAKLTPGAPATSTLALNMAAPPAVPAPATGSPAASTEVPTTPSSPVTATPHATPRHAGQPVAARAPAPRVRPADSSSALNAAVNAAATAPVITTPAPAPGAAQPPAQVNPISPSLNATPSPSPSTTAPPAGGIDNSGAPTATAPTVAPAATP